jgi:hypothetical protein
LGALLLQQTVHNTSTVLARIVAPCVALVLAVGVYGIENSGIKKRAPAACVGISAMLTGAYASLMVLDTLRHLSVVSAPVLLGCFAGTGAVGLAAGVLYYKRHPKMAAVLWGGIELLRNASIALTLPTFIGSIYAGLKEENTLKTNVMMPLAAVSGALFLCLCASTLAIRTKRYGYLQAFDRKNAEGRWGRLPLNNYAEKELYEFCVRPLNIFYDMRLS